MVPWECRFASHDHAVVFQLLNSEKKPMSMENLDMVMPTSRNPGRLDMADTAEAGTIEGPEWTCHSGVPYKYLSC